MISFVSFGEVWYLVLFGFIALGILAGTVGSMLSLHKYMKV
jgi:cell division protein FtsX